MMHLPRVYSQDKQLLAVLDHAAAIGYTLKNNDLSTATMQLPTDDEKNSACAAHNYVQLWDGEDQLDLFRIVAIPCATHNIGDGWTEYEMEHVVATLVDDLIFGYHEIGGPGIPTRAVIEYILSQQTTALWQLGRCDFEHYFVYKFENTNLLTALFSLGNVLTEEYRWTYDTTTTPWTINLIRPDASADCEIRYRRNMREIVPTMDASTLVTRLYVLGYGEGVNQLTISSCNGGIPYIDADTASVWGVKSSVYVDGTIEDAGTLLARGRALLEELKNPYMAYTASAIDLWKLTGDPWDRFGPGKLVHVYDDRHGIDFNARIISKSKPDVTGDPGNVELEIANRVRDIADSINQLADRQGITELYSQGATNLYSQQYADNADQAHPAEMRVYIPTGCVRINSVLLSWELSPFRAYETGAAAGGGTTSTTSAGGASTSTSSAGGASERTSRGGGAHVETVEQRVISTSAVTGGSVAGREGDTSGNTGWAMGTDGNAKPETSESEILTTGDSSQATTGLSTDGLRTGTCAAHTHTVAAHNHGMGHFHSGPSHSHSIESHRHSGGSHTHTFGGSGTDSVANGHTHKIPNPGTSTVTGGVSTNATHKVSISISGTTSSGGSSTGYTSLTTDLAGTGMTGNAVTSGGSARYYTTDGGEGTTSSEGIHNHTMTVHNHPMQHTHTVPGHTHNMSHRHNFSHMHFASASITIPAQVINIPSHSHVFETEAHTHSVSIPAHSHGLTLPDHTHDIIHGIYEGGTANGVSIRVDGVDIPASAVTADEMDIAQYLEKTDEGKVRRGTWHSIEIIPNALTRIIANLFVQVFVQSVGGGDY